VVQKTNFMRRTSIKKKKATINEVLGGGKDACKRTHHTVDGVQGTLPKRQSDLAVGWVAAKGSHEKSKEDPRVKERDEQPVSFRRGKGKKEGFPHQTQEQKPMENRSGRCLGKRRGKEILRT